MKYLALFCLLVIPALSFAQAKSDAAALYAQSIPAVVYIECTAPDKQVWQGSGVILRSDGIIATNYHVCGEAISARIKLKNGDIYDNASIIETDERKDIVILKIAAVNLPILKASDSDVIKIGSTVYAIGAPQGLEGTISAGIVSGIRPASEMFSWASGFKVIQISIPVTHGSSGGPLLDDAGMLIGLIFAGKEAGQLNAAIPINYVTPLALSTNPGKPLQRYAQVKTVSAPTTTNTVADIAGTYTGSWASRKYDVDGALVMTVTVTNGVAIVRAVFTGSEYFNEDILNATFTSMGAGIWKMDYKGQKSKVKGTGLFKAGRFVGDYKFGKLLWVDTGDWLLTKTS